MNFFGFSLFQNKRKGKSKSKKIKKLKKNTKRSKTNKQKGG